MTNRMITISLITIRQFVEWLMVLALVWPFTACSGGGDDEAGGSNMVSWKEGVNTISSSAGSATLLISEQSWPGTTWRAEIVAGSEWLSFAKGTTQTEKEGTVAVALSARVIYLYYTANTTTEEREAMIRFTFEGQTPISLLLTQRAGNGGGSNPPSGGEDTPSAGLEWPELPTMTEQGNYFYTTHYTPVRDVSQGGQMISKRNFTLCYDKEKRAAWWVAYPLHSVYMGSTGRTEAWEYDPNIEKSWQPMLYSAYNNGGTWHRGHQLPSADRTATREMNAQTFYFSNMTPQNGTLNSNKWATLEGKVRNWACSDTLYVVTGAYWASTSNYTTDKSGNVCPTPTHYFKVVARTRKGDVREKGDRLGDYAASELQSIGFWVEHKPNSSVGEVSSWARSVQEIEQLTGFEFFPTLPAEVKTQKNAAQWGL